MVHCVGPLGRFWGIVAKSVARLRIVAVVAPKLRAQIIGHLVGVNLDIELHRRLNVGVTHQPLEHSRHNLLAPSAAEGSA